MEEKTVFEHILEGKIPADIVNEGTHFVAFRDIAPMAPIHVLVIPRQKVRSFHNIADLDPEVLTGFMHGIRETAEKLGLKEDGYRIVFNTGANARQSVDYIHAHILGGTPLEGKLG